MQSTRGPAEGFKSTTNSQGRLPGGGDPGTQFEAGGRILVKKKMETQGGGWEGETGRGRTLQGRVGIYRLHGSWPATRSQRGLKQGARRVTAFENRSQLQPG